MILLLEVVDKVRPDAKIDLDGITTHYHYYNFEGGCSSHKPSHVPESKYQQ